MQFGEEKVAPSADIETMFNEGALPFLGRKSENGKENVCQLVQIIPC